MNGSCILVPQANFSDGGFAKLDLLPRTIFLYLFYFIYFFFFFFFFTGRVVGLVGLPLSSFQFVMGVLRRR